MSPFGIPIPDDLAELQAIHRALFGGWKMQDDGDNADNADEDSSDDTDNAPGGDDTDDDNKDDADDFDPARALSKIKKLNSENRQLRAAKKAAEGKAAGSDEKDSRIKTLEAENLRIRIGARHGLPDELIDRLKGDTEEEILADAEKLLAIVAGRKPPTQRSKETLRGGGNPQVEVEETDPRKLAAMIPRQ